LVLSRLRVFSERQLLRLRVAGSTVDSRQDYDMALKPNYSFERRERERLQAVKAAEKAEAKRRQKEQDKAQAESERPQPDDSSDGH
jgi:hypothetical protein